MALGTNQMTTTTGAKFLPDVWSTQVVKATENNLVMADKVMRFDEQVAEKGQTLHIPNVSNLTANDKVANTQVTLQSPTEAEQTISINKHKETSFVIEDLLKTQSAYNLLSVYTDKSGYAIAAQFDSDIITAATFTQVQGTVNTPLVDSVILASFQKLDEANAPVTDRHFVIAPKGKKEVMSIDKFTLHTGPGYMTEDSPILHGVFGDMYGADVSISMQIPGATGTSTNNLLFHKEAFAAAMQEQPRVQSQYKQEYLGWLVTVDTIYGVTKLRDKFGVVVLD
jgi:hypothetical protein